MIIKLTTFGTPVNVNFDHVLYFKPINNKYTKTELIFEDRYLDVDQTIEEIETLFDRKLTNG